MFHSRKIKDSVSKIHARVLRLIYPSDPKLTFKELSDKKNCEHP